MRAVVLSLGLLYSPAALVAQDCAPLSPNLLGWWRGEGNAVDEIGANDGSLLNGLQFGAGKSGSSFILDGKSYVSVPDTAALDLTAASAFTLDVWVYPTEYPPNVYVPLSLTKPYRYGLLYNTTYSVLRGHVHDGSAWIFADALFELPLREWTHVAQTWDGQVLRIYANGELVGADAAHGTPEQGTDQPAYIGKWEVPGRNERFTFEGSLDEVTIYDGALSASDVRAVFEAGEQGRCRFSSIEIVQSGPRCVSIAINNRDPMQGGEIGVAYDPAIIVPVKAAAGPDLPAGAQIQFEPLASVQCEGSGVLAGFTVGWLNSFDAETMTPPGRNVLLKICFTLAPGAVLGSCSDLRFVSCLGVEQAPVRNIITGEMGKSVSLFTLDGQVCVTEDLPFQRGDANADGSFDISDPISLLGCLFSGRSCIPCSDAYDANDDGSTDISDAIYLLTWRFLSGPAPSAPFATCGSDPTPDDLFECEEQGSCP